MTSTIELLKELEELNYRSKRIIELLSDPSVWFENYFRELEYVQATETTHDFWKTSGETLIEFRKSERHGGYILWVSYKIWDNLNEKFELSSSKIEPLIKTVVEKYFKTEHRIVPRRRRY